MNKPWVDKYMVPLNACDEGVEKANQYNDPQTAWDNWDNGTGLLWTLEKTGADERKITLCRYEIVDRVIPIYEKTDPKDTRPRESNEAARKWANSPTEENRKAWDASRSAASDAASDAVSDPASNTANTAASPVAWDAARYAARAVAWDAARDAARAAAEGSSEDTTEDIENNAAWTAAWDAETQWQSDCVRRYFPASPFCKNKE